MPSHCVIFFLVLSCSKKSCSPHQKNKWPDPNLKKKWNLESIPPYPLYQEQQQHFKNGLPLWSIYNYHVFHSNNYMPCIPWLSPVFSYENRTYLFCLSILFLHEIIEEPSSWCPGFVFSVWSWYILNILTFWQY